MTMPNTDDTTIPQTKVTLFFNNIQITDKLQNCIREQLYDKEMKKYIKQRYLWTEKTFKTINWQAHELAIKKGYTAKLE